MKRLPQFFAAMVCASLLAGCAYNKAPTAPMTRAARSSFQPFHTENGEARFVINNIYFSSESVEANKPYFDAWLQEWLREFDFCRNGYDLMWTKTEPFEANPAVGGRLVTMGRCR